MKSSGHHAANFLGQQAASFGGLLFHFQLTIAQRNNQFLDLRLQIPKPLQFADELIVRFDKDRPVRRANWG